LEQETIWLVAQEPNRYAHECLVNGNTQDWRFLVFY